MAKKIILTYNEIPSVGHGFSWNIYINSVLIPYTTGYTSLEVNYINSFENNPPNDIDTQETLTETLNNTVFFLREYYNYALITYTVIDNFIEVLINSDNVTIELLGIPNNNIEVNVIDLSNIDYENLRYFFQYKNIINDEYICRIFKRNYFGESQEIHGKVLIDKGSVTEHLDVIRGTGLTLKLEASNEFSFEDLYSDNEQDFSVRLYKNTNLIYVGYLKPDGIFQSFTADKWEISLDCVDGLGALKNLSFVKDNGLRFTGRMFASDIIYYCLKRSGINLNINTSVNVYYNGLAVDETTDIFTKIKLNSDRFFKTDGNTSGDGTIMSCEDVLKSVLDLFSACITQQDGQWYIYKPNELYNGNIVNFKHYDLENKYVRIVSKNLKKAIGSQIDNFYPFHCNANQKIEIKGSISAFRLGYKYGYVSGLSENPNLERDGLNYEGWTINTPYHLLDDPNQQSGFLFKNLIFATNEIIATSDLYQVTAQDSLLLSMSWVGSRSFFAGSFIQMSIRCGSHYLKYSPGNDKTPFQGAIDNSVWTTNSADTWTVYLFQTGSFDFPFPTFPENADLEFKIKNVYPSGGTTLITKFDLKPNAGAKAEIGEFHTVSRAKKVSTIIKENKSVYNGDNDGIIYLGAIFKEDGVIVTNNWNRGGYYESLPILRIASEEELRISQKPLKYFTGDVYGYLPYLSIITINNIDGKFMFLEYSYDTMTNITSFKLLELYSAELSDIIYKFTLDYGNVVTPTITS